MSVESHLEMGARDRVAQLVTRLIILGLKLIENLSRFSTIFLGVIGRDSFTMRSFFFLADAIFAERVNLKLFKKKLFQRKNLIGFFEIT